MLWMYAGHITTAPTAARRLGAISNAFRRTLPIAKCGPARPASTVHHHGKNILFEQGLVRKHPKVGFDHRSPSSLIAPKMASLSAGLRHDQGKKDKGGAGYLNFAAIPQTYDGALRLLSLLPTNRDVTALFETPPKGEDGAPFDFNSLAVPEVVAWMARAGYSDIPKDLAPLKCIHIAGTKGKGSVSAFTTAILVEAAKTNGSTVGRVGTYLSPHVVSVRERIWLDGKPISRDLFTKNVFDMWARLSEAAAAADPSDPDPYGAHTKPFYFRFLTLLAFHIFLQQGVRSAVIECGIGGEYDATNILPATSVTTAVVTRLGIDHVAMLGRTLEEIAWHKAGIFKEGVTVFTLQQGPGDYELSDKAMPPGESKKDREAAVAVLRSRAAEKNVKDLHELRPDVVAQWSGVPGASLPGKFQKFNMALAVAAACHHLCKVGIAGDKAFDLTAAVFDPSNLPEYYVSALAKVTLRGRCESIMDTQRGSCSVQYIVDGAHTADSLGEVARFFSARQSTIDSASTKGVVAPRSKRILLFSVRDRKPGDLIRALLSGANDGGKATSTTFFDDAFFVFPPEAEAARAEALVAMQAVSPDTVCQAVDTVAAAIGQIRALAAEPVDCFVGAYADATAIPSQSCHVLATGSFVLVREVLQELDAEFEE